MINLEPRSFIPSSFQAPFTHREDNTFCERISGKSALTFGRIGNIFGFARHFDFHESVHLESGNFKNVDSSFQSFGLQSETFKIKVVPT